MQRCGKEGSEKVGILTFHFTHNCGAVLQAYALCKAVSKYRQCEIIDYRPEYHASWYDYRLKYEYPPNAVKSIWACNQNKLRASASIVFNLPKLFQNPRYQKDKERTKVFEDFVQKYLPCSELYRTKEEVEKHAGDYGTIISGSDQVWNLGIANDGRDDTYFLPFCDAVQKYSYAASIGGKWNLENTMRYAEYLRTFSGVSCREPDCKKVLEKQGISCRLDIDPALLLAETDYLSLEKRVSVPRRFVFVYAFHVTDELASVLKYLHDFLECELISYPLDGKLSEAVGFHVREIEPLGPAEFLYLMHYSDFVVTSTFHGAVFATIYKKSFICLSPGYGENRTENYLHMAGLDAQCFSSIDKIELETDYRKFDEIIPQIRRSSEKYIQEICANN